MTLPSYAKVNLFLKVLKLRKDNFHSIKTFFHRIDISDKVIIMPQASGGIEVYCNDPEVPRNQANICYKAARLLKDRFRVDRGVKIRIYKNIPVGAGLGGGSSNAATVLTGLNKLWGLRLSRDKLAGIAAEIGSDVPFFVYDVPFALGTGRGEKVFPLDNLKNLRISLLLVVPKISVATARIYRRFDQYINSRPGEFCALTGPSYNDKIFTSVATRDTSFLSGLLFNSLEPVTAKLYPEVTKIKDALRRQGLGNILMSGSGPAVFALVDSLAQARFLSKRIQAQARNWRVFVTGTH